MRVCRIHGGRSPAMMAAGPWKHGRYSRYLPQGLLERYEAAAADKELLALRDEIRLLDVRLSELVERIGRGESSARWERLRKLQADMDEARARGDREKLAALLMEMRRLIEEGAGETEVWRELIEVIEVRARLVEQERRRLLEAHYVLSLERAFQLMREVGESVRRHVQDPKAVREVAEDLRRLILQFEP